MIVVAIIGLIAAMGVPSILQMYHQDGMRKAVIDIQNACVEARARAIEQNQKVYLILYPPPANRFEIQGGQSTGSGSIASGTLPAGVDIAMLDISLADYTAQPYGSVCFNPDGTSQEMTVVLHSRDEWRKITLEYATAIASVSDVNE